MKQLNQQHPSQGAQARRRFFGWISKIASSTALAGVGLGLTNTPGTFAATESKDTVFLASSLKRKPKQSTPSSCIDCTDCVTLECVFNNCSGNPYYPYEIIWEVDSGCAPHCSTTWYSVCASTCYNPC